MAKDNKDMVVSPIDAEIHTIEDLSTTHKTLGTVFAGTKVMKKWKTGKQITDDEYKEAVEEFLKAPAGRE